MSLAMHQAIARALSADTTFGSLRSSSLCSNSPNRWWYRYHWPRRSSGTTKPFVRSSVSSVWADCLVWSTASHSPPHMRSSTDV